MPLALGEANATYAGFDQNNYPGDSLLPALHRIFAFTGYWLSPPPGTQQNSWVGKRASVEASGLGFLLLYSGRSSAQLAGKDAAALGRADALAAVAAATREGFPAGAVIFLDQEEGGRLLAAPAAYLFSWIDAIRRSKYKPGVYCSGIPVGEGATKMTTAGQISDHEKGKPVTLWVVNDSVPPAPGCVLSPKPLAPASSGISNALVWQYARSPRTEFALRGARSYAADGNCYVPGMPHSPKTFVDLNVSTSVDPSGGR